MISFPFAIFQTKLPGCKTLSRNPFSIVLLQCVTNSLLAAESFIPRAIKVKGMLFEKFSVIQWFDFSLNDTCNFSFVFSGKPRERERERILDTWPICIELVGWNVFSWWRYYGSFCFQRREPLLRWRFLFKMWCNVSSGTSFTRLLFFTGIVLKFRLKVGSVKFQRIIRVALLLKCLSYLR